VHHFESARRRSWTVESTWIIIFVDSNYDEKKKFDGVQTEAVEEAIADFVQQVTGWFYFTFLI
jgi:hypothetical protein